MWVSRFKGAMSSSEYQIYRYSISKTICWCWAKLRWTNHSLLYMYTCDCDTLVCNHACCEYMASLCTCQDVLQCSKELNQKQTKEPNNIHQCRKRRYRDNHPSVKPEAKRSDHWPGISVCRVALAKLTQQMLVEKSLFESRVTDVGGKITQSYHGFSASKHSYTLQKLALASVFLHCLIDVCLQMVSCNCNTPVGITVQQVHCCDVHLHCR